MDEVHSEEKWLDVDVETNDGKHWNGAVNWGIETDDRGDGFVWNDWYINFYENKDGYEIDWDSIPPEVQVEIYRLLDEDMEERKKDSPEQ